MVDVIDGGVIVVVALVISCCHSQSGMTESSRSSQTSNIKKRTFLISYAWHAF
jgi:hypothetical protein